MQFTVIDHSSQVAVLRLRGELDAHTAPILYSALDDLVSRTVPRIVVDLAGLRFCDSVGLSAFVTAYVTIAERGGWLRFAGPNLFLERLIHTVGLTRYIGVYDDVEQAALAAA